MRTPARLALFTVLLAVGCAAQVGGGNGAPPGDDTPPTPTPRPGPTPTPTPTPTTMADAAAPAPGPATDAGAPPADARPPVDVDTTARPAPTSDAGPAPPSMPAAFCGTGATRLGPPTAAEIKLVDSAVKANPPVPAGTNKGNNFAYGTAGKNIGDMRTMFSLTSDLFYLDRALVFADYMLSVRNDPVTGRVLWTGKREPCWPNNADDAPDAGTCGAETGAVANQLLQTAKIIVGNKALWDRAPGTPDPHGYGATYILRARTYLREAEKSMEYFLAHYIDPAKGNTIHTPSDAAYGALGPNYLKALGRNVPWNQQDMITAPLAAIGDILLVLKEDMARVASNDVVVQASMNAFIAELKANTYMVNGVTVYKWGYNPGDLFHVEDLAHASADINALYNAYKRGRYAIDRETLVPIANTFLQLVAKPDGTYAAHVDGKGSRAAVSTSWTNYDEFAPGITRRLVPVLTIDATTPLANAITILNLRRKYCP
jgi:hypothetical protein